MTVTTETTVLYAWGWLVVYVVLAIAVIALGIWLGLWISIKTGVLRLPAAPPREARLPSNVEQSFQRGT